jgi:ATP-binding cassette subfamily F protein uup
VLGYLKDFLFDPERARLPVRFLSGGERNRVLLARHFAKPANVIVLDEPTNDLDAETLELLEERLMEFAGTVLVVSHDRAFLDNVVTSLLVFEPTDRPAAANGPGGPAFAVKEYVGGYSDWLRQRPQAPAETKPAAPAKRPATESVTAATVAAPATKRRKLSFKEQQELATLPALIESLEAEITGLHAAMAAPEYYRQAGDLLARERSRLEEREGRLTAAYARWEELEPPGGA